MTEIPQTNTPVPSDVSLGLNRWSEQISRDLRNDLYNLKNEDSTFIGAMEIDGSTDISGNLAVSGDLTADKISASDLSFSGDFVIDGSADFSTANFDGTVDFTSIGVDGTASLADVSVSGWLGVDGSSDFSKANFDGTADFSAIGVDGTASLVDVSISGWCGIDGTCDISSVNVDGSAEVGGILAAGDASGAPFAFAWVNCASHGAINTNHNISTVTRTAAGKWDVSFASNPADANYVVVLGTKQRTATGTTGHPTMLAELSASGFEAICGYATLNYDLSAGFVAVVYR